MSPWTKVTWSSGRASTVAEDEIVQHDDVFSLREKVLDRVRADVARAAGDEKSAFAGPDMFK